MLNKEELERVLSKRLQEKGENIPPRVSKLLMTEFIEVFQEELGRGGSVKLRGLGTFSVKVRPERNGINPKTFETIRIAEKKRPYFKASPILKEVVEKGNDNES